MFASPNQPNIADFRLFIANGMGLGPGLVPQPIAAPATPVLTPGSSGTLPTGDVYAVTTYVTAYGETTASAEASAAVTGPTGSASVASPPASSGATGYNVYAAGASGAEVLQNTSPVAVGTPYLIAALATGTISPPAQNMSGSPWPVYALQGALDRVILPPPCMAGIEYTLAVYNCAGHLLLTMIPPQPGQPQFPEIRHKLGLEVGNFGVVQSASDQATSTSLAVPDALKQLTLDDLGFTQTIYGRRYLGYNQDFGPNIFGIT